MADVTINMCWMAAIGFDCDARGDGRSIHRGGARVDDAETLLIVPAGTVSRLGMPHHTER
jgi:hypothetical protein